MYRLPSLARQVASSRSAVSNTMALVSNRNFASTTGPKMAQAQRAAAESFARRLTPMLDRVIVQKAEAVTRSKGGIVIPEKAQGKVLEGTIVAVGPGMRNEKGEHIPIAVKVGDSVILPEYGGTKVEIDENEVYIYREHDILAILEKK